MLIPYRESIMRSAESVAALIAPHLVRQLEAVHGPGWLEIVNSNMTLSGRRPGSGLDDPHPCLAVFAYDPAVGWSHQAWRTMARTLLDLLDRMHGGQPVTNRDSDRAFTIADAFHHEWGGSARRIVYVNDGDDGPDDHGLEQTRWFTLSFTRGSRPDARGEARGDASSDPLFVATDIVWRYSHELVMEHLRRASRQVGCRRSRLDRSTSNWRYDGLTPAGLNRS